MLIVRAIRRRLASEEGGYTLIELLVTVSIGVVVLIGLMNLIDTTGRANARLTDKAETAQRVRVGVDRVARVLRTQACLNVSTPPLISGTADSVQFWSDTPTKTQVDNGQDDTNIVFQPKRVTLTFDPSAGTITQTTETPAAGKSPEAGDYMTNATSTSRVLITNVVRMKDTNGDEMPVFRYYTFSAVNTALTASSLDGNLGTDPVPGTSVKRIVKIDVALEGKPTSGNPDSNRNTDAQTTVITRNADLSGGSDPGRQWGPRCG